MILHKKKTINLELKLLKTDMILAFISVNNMGSHNVRTQWMYLHILNTGPEDGLMKPKHVVKTVYFDYILMCCDWIKYFMNTE